MALPCFTDAAVRCPAGERFSERLKLGAFEAASFCSSLCRICFSISRCARNIFKTIPSGRLGSISERLGSVTYAATSFAANKKPPMSHSLWGQCSYVK